MRRYCYALVKVEMVGSDTIDMLSDLKAYLDPYLEKEEGFVKLEHVIETFEKAPSNYPLEMSSDENIEDALLANRIEVETWTEFHKKGLDK